MTPPSYHVPALPTGTEARVCELIARRQQMGRIKYGTTVADNPVTLLEWLRHQQCELADALVYCTRAIEEIEKREPETE